MRQPVSKISAKEIELNMLGEIDRAYPNALDQYYQHVNRKNKSEPNLFEKRDLFAVHLLRLLNEEDVIESSMLDARQRDLLIHFATFPTLLGQYLILVRK